MAIDPKDALPTNPNGYVPPFKTTPEENLQNCITVPPQVPMTEEYIWLTNILKTENNSEQRIKLRKVPRKIFHLNFSVDEEDSINYFKDILSKTQSIYLPMFYLQGNPKSNYREKGTKIECDRAYIFLITKASSIFAVNPITKEYTNVGIISGTGHTMTTTPLERDITKDWILYPSIFCYANKKASLERYSQGGLLKLDLYADTTSSYWYRDFKSPLTLNFLDNTPLLVKRPFLSGKGKDYIVSNYQQVGSLINKVTIFPEDDNYNVKKLNKLSFIISGTDEYDYVINFEYWNTFLDYIGGSNKAFLMPTWEADLKLTGFASKGLYIDRTEKALSLKRRFDSGEKIYLYLFIGEEDYTVNVDRFYELGGGNIRLGLDEFPEPLRANDPKSVTCSMVNRVRIDDDRAQFKHYQNHSILSFNTLEIKI